MNPLEQYLWLLQDRAEGVTPGDVLLWPRTPMDRLQEQIKQMVGVDDRPGDERSRLYRIIEYLETTYTEPQTVLDICCGDALILYNIKCVFPKWDCYGLDINAGELITHKGAVQGGVRLFKATIQDLFASCPSRRFDIVMMLNTYRGWESADLREHESELPQQANYWIGRYAKTAILTATAGQVRMWKAPGCEVTDLGRGEQVSRLVVVKMKGG